MQFLYNPNAKDEKIKLVNEFFSHLKARRAKLGERVELRNLEDEKAYLYEIIQIDKKSAILELVFTSSIQINDYKLNIGWAVIDPKTIEKSIAFLNELGVGKIAFVYTQFSQSNFKIDIERLKYLCAMSSEQCGREKLMEFEIYKNLEEFLTTYKDVALIDFNGKDLNKYQSETLLIGPEGGFSEKERDIIKNSYGLNSKNILRSQTAIMAVASKILL